MPAPPLDLDLCHIIIERECPDWAGFMFRVGRLGPESEPMPIHEAMMASSADSPEALFRCQALAQGVLAPGWFCGDDACEAKLVAVWNR